MSQSPGALRQWDQDSCIALEDARCSECRRRLAALPPLDGLRCGGRHAGTCLHASLRHIAPRRPHRRRWSRSKPDAAATKKQNTVWPNDQTVSLREDANPIGRFSHPPLSAVAAAAGEGREADQSAKRTSVRVTPFARSAAPRSPLGWAPALLADFFGAEASEAKAIREEMASWFEPPEAF